MEKPSSFEDEILALNPEHDLIFGKYQEKYVRNDSPNALEPNIRLSSPRKMKIISKMNEIINAKPVGELPSENDWNDQLSTETETITLMRKLGLEQSVDRPPDEKCTIATVPTNKDVILMKNGRKKMSIFMAHSYFELKPRSEPSFDFDDDDDNDNIAPNESTISDFSDDVNQYQPIINSSTQDTESTSLSEDPEENSRQWNRNLGRRKSSESNRKSATEKNLRDSPRKYNSNNKGFSDSGTSSRSSSNRSNREWRNLNDNFSDKRDENNWRRNVSQNKESKEQEKQQPNETNNVEKILNQTITLSKDTRHSDEVSNCGRVLYKPKDLFMKKKLIQQVLAENQS